MTTSDFGAYTAVTEYRKENPGIMLKQALADLGIRQYDWELARRAVIPPVSRKERKRLKRQQEKEQKGIQPIPEKTPRVSRHEPKKYAAISAPPPPDIKSDQKLLFDAMAMISEVLSRMTR